MRSTGIPLSVTLAPLLLQPLVAFAQTENSTYLQGLATALQGLGFTQLANAAVAANDTAEGQALLADLSQTNRNFTIFAPSDAAFQAANSSSAITNATNNVTNTYDLANILAYHVVEGTFTNFSVMSNSSSASNNLNTTNATLESNLYPNDIVGRTLLNASSLVQLEGNRSQVIAWTQLMSTSMPYVLNQATNVTISNATSYSNLLIAPIAAVLTPPQSLLEVIATSNLSTFGGILSGVPAPAGYFTDGTNGTYAQALNSAGGNNTRARGGYTLFAPNAQAVSNAMGTLSGLSGVGNDSNITSVLNNHVIPGQSVYSPLFSASKNYTSSAGEPISVVSNSTGRFVSNGNVTAMIVQADLLVSNGVVHVIDNVLFNTASDVPAASSAYAAATSSAAQSTTETGALGVGTAVPTMSLASSMPSMSSASMASQSTSVATGAGGGTVTSTQSGFAPTAAI